MHKAAYQEQFCYLCFLYLVRPTVSAWTDSLSFIVLYGGPSSSHVFLASKQRSTSFCNEIINSVRVFILFYLRFSILNCLLKAILISKGFSILNQI